MKKKPIVITIATSIIMLLALFCIWFFGPYASNEGNTEPWKPGYASPKQYYEENGQNLKGTTKTIDGISYTFDDLGSVMQDENNGKWINDTKYKLDSGIELKSMWYEINGNLYYFNNKGMAIKNRLIKVNNKQYAFDNNGVLKKYFFKIWGHTFGTIDDGSIIENGYYFPDGKRSGYGLYYGSNFRGHGHKVNTTAVEFKEGPYVMWKEKEYHKNSPEYFIEKDYELVGTTIYTAGGATGKDGETSAVVTQGSYIYLKNDDLKQIYIYDKTDNSFYSYVPD